MGRVLSRTRSGFSLVEVVVVVAALGVMATVAVPAYRDSVLDAEIARTTGDIRAIEAAIITHRRSSGDWPADLAAVGHGDTKDPWGESYQYLVTNNSPPGARKDKFLKPLNSDFDLYSMGPDGQSSAPLMSPRSHDDIVRANNGKFVGVATAY